MGWINEKKCQKISWQCLFKGLNQYTVHTVHNISLLAKTNTPTNIVILIIITTAILEYLMLSLIFNFSRENKYYCLGWSSRRRVNIFRLFLLLMLVDFWPFSCISMVYYLSASMYLQYRIWIYQALIFPACLYL